MSVIFALIHELKKVLGPKHFGIIIPLLCYEKFINVLQFEDVAMKLYDNSQQVAHKRLCLAVIQKKEKHMLNWGQRLIDNKIFQVYPIEKAKLVVLYASIILSIIGKMLALLLCINGLRMLV